MLNFSKITRRLMLLELFLMIFAATYLMNIKKIILMLILILITVQHPLKKLMKFDKKMFIWVSLYIIIGGFSIFNGILSNNPESTTGFIVTIIEPIIFLFVFSNLDVNTFYYLKQSLLYITFVLCSYIIFCFFCLNDIIFISLKSSLPFFNRNIGGTQFAMLSPIYGDSITWLYFLLPAYITRFICGKNDLTDAQWKMVKIDVSIGVICTICSLKTALILVTASSFIIAILLNKYKTGNKIKIKSKVIKRVVLCIALLTFIIVSFYPKIEGIISPVLQKVKVSFGIITEINRYGIIDSGISTRTEQISALVEAWYQKPLLGWGSGVNAPGVIRSAMAGNYEMTFFARLMQSGLLLVIIREILIVWLYVQMLKIIKRKNEFSISASCILAGLTGMLFANLTNPYLESFDRLIILFLPLLIYKINKQYARYSF